jgi:hypothetical protein
MFLYCHVTNCLSSHEGFRWTCRVLDSSVDSRLVSAIDTDEDSLPLLKGKNRLVFQPLYRRVVRSYIRNVPEQLLCTSQPLSTPRDQRGIAVKSLPNYTYWEDPIACFHWYDTHINENDLSNTSSIVAYVFVTAVYFEPNRCLTMARINIQLHRLMRGTGEVHSLYGLTCRDIRTEFHKDWFKCSKVNRVIHRHTRVDGDRAILLSFFKQEN